MKSCSTFVSSSAPAHHGRSCCGSGDGGQSALELFLAGSAALTRRGERGCRETNVCVKGACTQGDEKRRIITFVLHPHGFNNHKEWN
eukprot:2562678-Pleurochrysis_carterae.AAC.1